MKKIISLIICGLISANSKKQLLALLLTSLVFTAGCGEEAQSADNTLEVSSEAESSMAETVTDIPKVEYDYDIYERFTPNEIANMSYSPMGLFSYTIDYDFKSYATIASDETLNAEFKLTNMTNLKLSIETNGPPTAGYESVLVNPASFDSGQSGSDQIRFTFEPYETKVFSYSLNITDDTKFDGRTCYFYSSVVFFIYEPPIRIEDFPLAFYVVRVDHLPVSIKDEE